MEQLPQEVVVGDGGKDHPRHPRSLKQEERHKEQVQEEEESDDDDGEEKTAEEEQDRVLNRFCSLLHMPKTEFPRRQFFSRNGGTAAAAQLEKWLASDLYEKVAQMNSESEAQFVIHDGPPFANGSIHLGHAYNRILKDILCKFHRMDGRRCEFVPGNDCHGLPIEMKIFSELQQNSALTPIELIARCRQFSSEWCQKQASQTRQLGVVASFGDGFRTSSSQYESGVMRVFAQLVSRDLVQRKLRTVPWCLKCQTVLAAAELESRTDLSAKSILVAFPLQRPSSAQFAFPEIEGSATISFLVDTSSAWSLPMCRAILLSPKSTYGIVKVIRKASEQPGSEKVHFLIIGYDRIESVRAFLLANTAFSSAEIVKNSIPCADLLRMSPRVLNPSLLSLETKDVSDIELPVLCDDGVSRNEGTAVLHLAPGCGPKDYSIGSKLHLEIYSPLSFTDGRFKNVHSVPEYLRDLSLCEAQTKIIEKLDSDMLLFSQSDHSHIVSICWRCKSDVLYLPSKQWFLSLSDVQQNITACVNSSSFLPKDTRSALHHILLSREDWCLSRQRVWGVPMCAVTCRACQSDHLYPKIIQTAAEFVSTHGIEWYWTDDARRVLLEELMVSTRCAKCQTIGQFSLSRDTLDVWFESGLVHHLAYGNTVADLYVEGKDQLRGWFAASSILSALLHQRAPTRAFLTHGFCVSSRGEKISKSSNMNSSTTETTDASLLPPSSSLSLDDVLREHGADRLRLWVAMTPYAADMKCTPEIMLVIRKEYSRVRKTLRALLAHLHDFDPSKHRIELLLPQENEKSEHNPLCVCDMLLLSSLFSMRARAMSAFAANDISFAVKLILGFMKSELRSHYLDSVKDRTYFIADPNSRERRSAQTAIFHCLCTLNTLLAPVLSFLSEEVCEYVPVSADRERIFGESIHLQKFHVPPDVLSIVHRKLSTNLSQDAIFRQIAALEKLRIAVQKKIGKSNFQSLKCALEISVPKTSLVYDALHSFFDIFGSEFLEEFLRVSEVRLMLDEKSPTNFNPKDLFVIRLKMAEGRECPRCWRFHDTANQLSVLCSRCEQNVNMWRK